MRLATLVLGAILLVPTLARADSVNGDFSRVLTTTPVRLIPDATVVNRSRFYRVCNVDATVTAWLTRASQVPAPHLAGSYAILPGKCEEFQLPQFIPPQEVWAAAESGTVQLTAEVH